MVLTLPVLEIYIGETVVCCIFDRYLNFDSCQPEVVTDVISGMVDQDVVCANFGDSKLKLSEASFSAVFRTSITSVRKYTVTSYPVRLYTRRV